MSNYRDQLESYLKTQEILADRVIDVGGRSKPVSKRVKDWQVKDYEIFDSGLEEGEKFTHFNLNEPHFHNPELAEYVFCLEVMEYITDPVQAIVNLNYLTKPGGIIYITFPFLYPVHEPKQADALRYTADGASRLLGEQHFKILDIINRVMTPTGFTFYKQFLKAEGLHASKHSRHDLLGFIIKAQKDGLE